MKKYEQHPIGAAWPALSDEDFQKLVDSIESIGILEKITVYEGKILDGWHRYRACTELRVKNIPMVEYEGNDPGGFVIAKNDARRHEDKSQRAFAIAETLDICEKSGRPSRYVDSNKPGKIAGLTTADAAAIAGVSERTMREAKAVTKAESEVKEAVKAGEMSVSEAAKLSKLPPEEQRAAVSAPKERKPKVPKAPKPPKIESEETVPLAEYRILQDKYDELSSNYQVLAAELDACEAIRNGEQMDHFKKLNQQLVAVTASRDEFQNKCGELTRQVNYLNAKLKKTKE
jgi:ParB-like chromosome segregation protein Spo0J